jgi:hypothetical protein
MKLKLQLLAVLGALSAGHWLLTPVVHAQAIRIPAGLLDTNAAAPTLVRAQTLTATTGTITTLTAPTANIITGTLATNIVGILQIGGTNYTAGIMEAISADGSATNWVITITP